MARIRATVYVDCVATLIWIRSVPAVVYFFVRYVRQSPRRRFVEQHAKCCTGRRCFRQATIRLSNEHGTCHGNSASPTLSLSSQFLGDRFCKTVRPLLFDRCPVPSVRPVCDVGVLWTNGWTDHDETWHEGRPRSRPHCLRWGTSSPQSGPCPL